MLLPMVVEYVPGSHAIHSPLEPHIELYVPGVQTSQPTLANNVEEVVPGVHKMHWVALIPEA